MEKTLLEVEEIHYVYGNGKSALENVSVIINEGEKIAVMGSNGSGKSTFFLNINGVLMADKGTIKFKDTVVNKKNLKELRKNIGIVFQDADNQIIASTVSEEVGFGPMNLKLPKEEVRNRVEEAMTYMNISHLKDRPPHYLSGGEKKRVTIADIIAMKPEIIIFDEPTAALDPLNATILEDVLDDLSEEGKTLLISTHDVDFAYRWANRIIVFSNGNIIADGTPLEIFKNEKILKEANLKRPMMVDVYEILIEKSIIKNTGDYPKSTDELRVFLEK